MEFWEYLDKVGMMHTGQGRVHPLHVEYVHVGVTLSFIQDILTEAVLSHPRLKMERKIALVKALSKVLWIQNDLFAKWYVRDGEEFAQERLVPQVEPEGYLHGKRVLHGSDSENEIEDAARAAGSCPFKNLAMSPKREGDRREGDTAEESSNGDAGMKAADAPMRQPTWPSTSDLSQGAIPQAVGSSA